MAVILRIFWEHIPSKAEFLIQSFYPAAVGATVKAADGKTYEMEMADEEGYFAVLIPVKK